jgi:hypothetical protein
MKEAKHLRSFSRVPEKHPKLLMCGTDIPVSKVFFCYAMIPYIENFNIVSTSRKSK